MPKVMVDVSGYRAQQRDALVKKAKEAAEKVRRWGDAVELEPLSSFDRRIIHNALRDDPDIETHSVEVEGTEKKVVLLPPNAEPVSGKNGMLLSQILVICGHYREGLIRVGSN